MLLKMSQKTKVVFKRSPKKDKKYMATFVNPNGHTKSVHFGAAGYSNYGGVGKEKHLSKKRKENYIKRHSAREDFNKPMTAGSLSRWVLWNKESFRKSVADYKRRFNFD